jgi:D-glycero-alpha-D-manno-heptose-7-phosphate kinase
LPGLDILHAGICRNRMTQTTEPLRTILSTAPIRIADCGGWTDTWFARYGSVFNIAVLPNVQVRLRVFLRDETNHRVIINAENFKEEYAWELRQGDWKRHPLLEAAIALVGLPEELAIHLTIQSEAPPGASTGTSAAVTVALLAALCFLNRRHETPAGLASMAHHIEYDILGFQCGIQDQFCAAYGGINFIEMDAFPHADVRQLQVDKELAGELNRRLKLIYLGTSHRSSDVHRKVISELEDLGPENPLLRLLRTEALAARDALLARDLHALGAAMTANTAVQKRLHPDLISEAARKVIETAQEYGALGWKMNGAGGDGGSVTVLCGDDDEKGFAMIENIIRGNASLRNLPIRLSPHGVTVMEE